MRFGQAHRVMIGLLAVTGILALVSSGQIATPVSAASVLLLGGALMIPTKLRLRKTIHRALSLSPLLLFGAEVLRILSGASVLEAAVEFAIGLQIIRIATRKGATHDQQIITLAWLHLIAGTVLGGGLSFAVFLGLFLILVPGTLTLSHLRREVEGNYAQGARDRTGNPVDVPRILRSRRVVGRAFLGYTTLLSVPIFVFTIVLFVFFPRVGLSLLLVHRPSVGRMIGFSDHVDLGKVGTLRSDPTIVIRYRPHHLPPHPAQRKALYLRGTALDHYDGKAWTRSSTTRVPAPHLGRTVLYARLPSLNKDKVASIRLEPITPNVVFIPPRTTSLHLPSRPLRSVARGLTIYRGAEDDLRYLATSEVGINYDVYIARGTGPVGQIPLRVSDRYLQLSPMPHRIASLASKWAGDAQTTAAKADAIFAHLRTGYTYDLNTPSGNAPNPLDDFLFVSKRGHCEYFSTAMAVMLRELKVPTRNVTGFLAGSYNHFGDYYSVRQADAHSWVEVFIKGRGWVRYDPTPPAVEVPMIASNGFMASMRDLIEAMQTSWDQRVVRYDLKQQLSIFRYIRRRTSAASNVVSGVTNNLTSMPRGSRNRLLAWLLGALLLAGGLWLARRLKNGRGHSRTPRGQRDQQATKAVDLYRTLDKAMKRAGIPRAPTTPPSLHVAKITGAGHPMADQVREVTQAYLSVRFGKESIPDNQWRHLASLAGDVSRYRPPPPTQSDTNVPTSSKA